MADIFFDFDGVIGYTGETNWQLIQALFPDVTREAYFRDHHMGNVYENPAVPFTPETVREYYARYNQELSVAHVADAVPSLQQLGVQHTLHIVTSNCEHAIRCVLRDAEVEGFFGHILGQEAHASKVEKFQRLFRELSITAHDTLYVTDTVGDLKEAQKVQLRTIAVTFGYHSNALLLEHYPTRMADHWRGVCAHVDNLLSN